MSNFCSLTRVHTDRRIKGVGRGAAPNKNQNNLKAIIGIILLCAPVSAISAYGHGNALYLNAKHGKEECKGLYEPKAEQREWKANQYCATGSKEEE